MRVTGVDKRAGHPKQHKPPSFSPSSKPNIPPILSIHANSHSSSKTRLTFAVLVVLSFKLLTHLAPDRRIWAFHQACNGKRNNEQYVDGTNGQHESHGNQP